MVNEPVDIKPAVTANSLPPLMLKIQDGAVILVPLIVKRLERPEFVVKRIASPDATRRTISPICDPVTKEPAPDA
jgi:hypothetical protein